MGYAGGTLTYLSHANVGVTHVVCRWIRVDWIQWGQRWIMVVGLKQCELLKENMIYFGH